MYSNSLFWKCTWVMAYFGPGSNDKPNFRHLSLISTQLADSLCIVTPEMLIARSLLFYQPRPALYIQDLDLGSLYFTQSA